MRYLLDTDHISFLQRRSGTEYIKLLTRINQYPVDEFAFSIISFHEQVIGVHSFINRAKSTTDVVRGYNLLSEVIQGFSNAHILSFDTQAAETFIQLRKQKVRIATMDLRIASIALSKELILLTRNVRDFQQVPKLVIEDWTI
ncbi:type II toxin-antitoxin system VapC family toxin [Crocosphaera sp.]|uniref:type II toxin-antitoxin system VapC family toxin n=1 Tax=Crocosphaera sp. TaxID=2729996 RepID=UPI00257D8229|nr:type II toxin-antitoxin system VapC family toxin [Crocosphaera sp.]NQZ63477.1 type II toxin-antitoxin system VapC family toxin [Crocosphaera sp.]